MSRRNGKGRSSVLFAHDAIRTLTDAREGWAADARRFAGRTIHCQLVREATAEIILTGEAMEIATRKRRRKPDLAFALSRRTLIELLERKISPTQALFNGVLRVAGPSEDLVEVHSLFLDYMDELGDSRRFRELLKEFKRQKMKPFRGRLLLPLSNGNGTGPVLRKRSTGRRAPR
jgi:hypothetical protein